MKPKLVATDLDGTLVRSDGTISPRSTAILAAVEESGVPLVIVTGRPPRWLGDIARQLDHHGVTVCANGALIYDLHTESVIHERPLATQVMGQVMAALLDELPDVVFGVEYGTSFAHEEPYVVRYRGPGAQAGVRVVPDRAGLLDRPAAKLLVRHPTLGADDLLAVGRAVAGDAVVLTHSSQDGLLEISAAGVTKASGLAFLAREYGIDAADTVAFGDMPNDLPMLAWAGRSYAVANAHPEVRAAASEVIPSNDDDGVARTLARWFSV